MSKAASGALISRKCAAGRAGLQTAVDGVLVAAVDGERGREGFAGYSAASDEETKLPRVARRAFPGQESMLTVVNAVAFIGTRCQLRGKGPGKRAEIPVDAQVPEVED